MIIYKVTNLINGKCYVGQTRTSLKERWKGHCKPSKSKSILTQAILKYGKDNFKIEILVDNISCFKILDSLEVYYIAIEGTMVPNGYNLKYSHQGSGQLSEQALLNMSNAQKERFKTKPHPRLGQFGIKNPRSKIVLCTTTGEIFESARQAAIKLNVNRCHVNTIARGLGQENRRSTKGYRFKYLGLSLEII